MAERMTKGIDTSNLPKLQELLSAYSNNGPADAVNSLAQGVNSGIDLSQKIAQRKEQHAAAMIQLQKEIQKAKEEAVKGQAREDLTKHMAPITSATPVSNAVPLATLGNVANVNPDTNQVEQTGPQIVSQDEAKRKAIVKSDLFNAAPEQTSGKIADSILGTNAANKPQIAIKEDGSFRMVTPDENGRFALEPGETLKDIASQRERAKPQFERNQIMRDRMSQAAQFKTADLAAKYGASVNPGALKGSDQIAAKAYDSTGRALTLIQQVKEQGGTTPQQLAELTSAVLRSVTGQTVVPQGLFNHYMPDTLKQRYANFESFIHSNPTMVEMDEYVQNMEDTINRERNFNKEIVEAALQRQSAGAADALKSLNPEAFKRVSKEANTGKGQIADKIVGKRVGLSDGKPDLAAALRQILPKK